MPAGGLPYPAEEMMVAPQDSTIDGGPEQLAKIEQMLGQMFQPGAENVKIDSTSLQDLIQELFPEEAAAGNPVQIPLARTALQQMFSNPLVPTGGNMFTNKVRLQPGGEVQPGLFHDKGSLLRGLLQLKEQGNR
tara:strand:+ start:442 stop:843 length:402 start_codon:yes stop_codon:yes gene_type:complete